MSTRLQRSESEHMTVQMTGEESAVVVQGDSGHQHVVTTDGSDAVACTCADFEHNLNQSGKCKHMLAWDEWTLDVLKFEDGEVVWTAEE